jgi:VWFA-related protein
MKTRGILSALASSLCLSISFSAQVGRGNAQLPNNSTVSTSPAARPDPTSSPAGDTAGGPQQEARIGFRTQTTLIQVPVVVTDKRGSHIHGLTRNEFHLFENGKEQKLATFEEVIASQDKFPATATQPGEFHNFTISEEQPRTVTVIALDTINTPFLDQTSGRRELVKYLANSVDSGQILALVILTSHGLQVVQGLTGDPEGLVRALKTASGELSAMHGVDVDTMADVAAGDTSFLGTFATPGVDPTTLMDAFVHHGDVVTAGFQQQNAIETTLNGFMSIAWALSGVRGRKSLIWATEGFPFSISSPESIPLGYLSTLYARTMEALSQAQISIYPVDVAGLVNTSMLDPRHSAVPRPQQMSRRAWLRDSSLDALDQFAEMTGGKAFYQTSDLALGFKRAADDASSYYLLSYYLGTREHPTGWRQLKVKVDQHDVEVRARKGFFVSNTTLQTDLARSSELNYALVSPIEGTGVPISVKWLGISGDGPTKKAGFVVRLPPNGVSFDSVGARRLNFDFAVAAYAATEKGGKAANSFGRTFAPSLTDAQVADLRTKGVGFSNALELAPGRYAVRFVVRDNVTGKIGSVTAPLMVN